jgi:flagellar basal-body rod modification protein FlgD
VNINSNYHAAAVDPTPHSTSTDALDGTGDLFMQLLSTQLKNQSPLDPVDPNQFVRRLVQFNTLDQIIGIRQLLQQFAGPATTTGSTQSAQGEQSCQPFRFLCPV